MVAQKLRELKRLISSKLPASWGQSARTAPASGRSEISVSNEVVAGVLGQISVLLAASVPLAAALEAIRYQNETQPVGKVLDMVVRSVGGGSSLSASMLKHPKVFPPVVVLFIRAGEQTGTLDKRLESAAALLERGVQLKKKIQQALVGPSVTLAVAITVLVLCSKFVIPSLADMYTGMNVTLPLITRFVLAAAAIIGHPLTWLFVALLIALTVRYWSDIRERLFILCLFIPQTRKWVGVLLCSEFCDITGSLVKEGVTVLAALRLVADNASFRYHRESLQGICKILSSEGDLAAALSSVPYFPSILGSMARISLESGSLDVFLHYLSKLMRDEVDMALDAFTATLEPLMIGCLGVICGVLMLGIFLPLYGILTKF